MEEKLKSKIDLLLQKVDNNKQREEELQGEILDCHQRRLEEEENVMQMHLKLQNLEETLRQKEGKNTQLKTRLFDKESESEGKVLSAVRENKITVNDKQNGQKLKDEYGDVLISSKGLKTKAEDVTFDIIEIESKLVAEEELQSHETKRIQNLQQEMQDLTEKLTEVITNMDDVTVQNDKQREKISALKTKYLATDEKALHLDMECRRLEKLLENLHSQINVERETFENTDTILKHTCYTFEKDNEKFGGEITDLHKAQSISRKK